MKSKSIISGLLITVITSCFTTAFANYPIPRYENGDYLYYQENMTLKEIGETISMSESRVCQLHAQGIMKLKNILSENRSTRMRQSIVA